jgi:(1->4)-alpha-D-glucan 1-alpha-D-glucosylmutase
MPNPFLDDFEEIQKKAAFTGVFNSLTQTLFKLTAPGMPDIYQGNELWDFSMVDPDNRRPVDYALRRELLKSLPPESDATFVRNLLENYQDGRIKLHLTRQLLRYRQQNQNLFHFGSYQPLYTEGSQAQRVCAFARRYDGQTVISVGTRLLYALTEQATKPPLGEVWEDSWLPLPEVQAGATFRNLLTGEKLQVEERNGQVGLPLSRLLQNLTVAFLVQA